jgi:hypothetical protein
VVEFAAAGFPPIIDALDFSRCGWPLLRPASCYGNSPVTHRRNLVIVRAGKSSLHPRWLDGGERRNWDLLVSYFDPEARHDHPADVQTVVHRGGKWDGLYQSVRDDALLDRYDHVWLPDDDIDTTTRDINAVFDAMTRFDLAVAQPSLSRDSYYTYIASHQCTDFALRYTNHVEIMVPCLSTALLRVAREDFRGSMSGFGMDYVWPRLPPAGPYKAAILDLVAVHHTRPVGGNLQKAMSSVGRTAREEERLLQARYGLQHHIPPLVYAALEHDGTLVEGQRHLGVRMARFYLRHAASFHHPKRARKKIWQMLRRHLVRRMDLTPVSSAPH